ncbi:MAG: hypothetical protein NT011_05970 [Kiritimatiellaeota bacterium]|nr:hypothetical protein [Kiritimatiellota bacterium]
MIGDGALIRNCLIVNNSSVAGGGGIKGDYGIIIQNCTIASNVVGGGGGGFDYSQYAGFPKIENTIIWGNSSGTAGASNWYVNFSNPSTTWVTFTNCCTAPDIYSNNVTGTAKGSLASGINTITNNPRYVNNATDFRLQPDSPCINAGVNRGWMEGALDYYGNRRIDTFRKTVDIGAYEYLCPGTVFIGH